MAGVDGILKFTKTDQFRFQLLGSSTSYPDSIVENYNQPEGSFTGGGMEAFYIHDTQTWDWYARYYEKGKKLRADLGFIPSVGTRYLDVGWGHTWNSDAKNWYTMLNIGAGYDTEMEIDGTKLHRAFTIWGDYNGPLQSGFHFWSSLHGERGYNNKVFSFEYMGFVTYFQPFGCLTFELEGRVGDQIDYANAQLGEVLRLNPEIEYKLGRHLSVVLDHTWERLDVNAGRLYTANITQLHLVYQFTRRMFLRTITQYVDYKRHEGLYADEVDPEEQHIFNQVLFSYKINPQTVLFLGYSDNHFGYRDVSITQTDRTFFAKIGYAWVL